MTIDVTSLLLRLTSLFEDKRKAVNVIQINVIDDLNRSPFI